MDMLDTFQVPDAAVFGSSMVVVQTPSRTVPLWRAQSPFDHWLLGPLTCSSIWVTSTCAETTWKVKVWVWFVAPWVRTAETTCGTDRIGVRSMTVSGAWTSRALFSRSRVKMSTCQLRGREPVRATLRNAVTTDATLG